MTKNYAAVRHHPKKVRAAYQRSTYHNRMGDKAFDVKIHVGRAGYYSGNPGKIGKFWATACVSRRGSASTSYSKCAQAVSSTPTKAVKSALHHLATKMK